MRRISSNSESGAILAIVIILTLALTITGIAFLNAGVMEYRLAKREDYKNKAFYIAEGGLERTIWNLRQHFKTEFESRWPSVDEPGVWPIGAVNEIPVDPVAGSPWTWIIRYGEEDSLPGDLGDGSYEVQLEYMPGEDKIRIESTGTVKDIPRTVQIYMKAAMASPWNNAIFAKYSALGGGKIEGEARIHGSVLILGEEGAEDPVMDMSGDAGIRNNYDAGAPQGMPFPLSLKVPPIENGDGIETLNAALRVKNGRVILDGNATVGENIPNNPIKRTMDEVHVPGGFIDDKGNNTIDHVFTDNPDPLSACPLIGAVEFPSLTMPAEEWPGYDTRLDYLQDLNLQGNSLRLEVGMPGDDGQEFLESEISSAFSFTKSDGLNSISWHWDADKGKIILEVHGIVWIDAGLLKMGGKDAPIEYNTGIDGGVIVVADYVDGTKKEITGNIEVHGDLLPVGLAESGGGFPENNALGLVTGTLGIAYPGEANLHLTGAFFAENAIHSGFQNEVAGTFVSNFFDMGGQVPRIYQVPELATHVPHGMPGGPPVWVLITSEWKELY